MPDPAVIHAASLAALEASYGAACPTFTWAGQTLPCLAGTADYMLKLGAGGFGSDSDLVLIVRLAVFGAGPQPQPEQTLTYNPLGKKYRVSEVQTPMGSPFLRLSLIDVTKGT